MNPFPDRRRLLSAAMTFGAAPLFASLNAFAETWPARTVRVGEPGGPGGGNDTTLRLFAPHLERLLGRQFTVEISMNHMLLLNECEVKHQVAEITE